MDIYVNESKDFYMELYVDENDNIRSVNKPIEGLKKIVVPEHLYYLQEIPEEVLLYYKFSYEDNVSHFMPRIEYNEMVLLGHVTENARLKKQLYSLYNAIESLGLKQLETLDIKIEDI